MAIHHLQPSFLQNSSHPTLQTAGESEHVSSVVAATASRCTHIPVEIKIWKISPNRISVGISIPNLRRPVVLLQRLILLRADGKNHAYNHQYMLWNPSMRKHIVIRATALENDPHPRLHHFYHDSTTADDRIVFVYKNCYAVYSCNDGSWSGMKDFPCELRLRGGSVAVDGCFYALRDGGTVCFDARDGKLHERRQPPNDVLERVVWLTPPRLNGSLTDYLSTPQIWEVERGGRRYGKWVVEADLGLVPSICSRDEDNVLLCLEVKEVEYNPWACRYQEVQKSLKYWSRMLSYSENLYMPCSNISE